jgi:hypothetical protein
MISLVECNKHSNMTSFFRFVNKRTIYRLGIISLAHAPMYVTHFPIVNVHVDELSSARLSYCPGERLCWWSERSTRMNVLPLYRIPLMARCTRYNSMWEICQWLVAGRWFSPVSSTNKTARHDITEIIFESGEYPNECFTFISSTLLLKRD